MFSDVNYFAIRDSLVSLYDIRVGLPLSVALAYPLINIITPVTFIFAGLCYVTSPTPNISSISTEDGLLPPTNIFRIASCKICFVL